MVGIVQIEEFHSGVPQWFLIFVVLFVILSAVKTEFILFLVLTRVSSKSEGLKFQPFKQSKKVILKELQNSMSQYFHNIHCTFISPIYTFP